MSLFTRPIRPANADLDVAVERRLKTLRAQVTPDPHFRRRLRGHAINRYVATRERIAEDIGERRQSRQMGRLGRAVLIASVTLAASAATALGSSQYALPGDPLYGLKLRVEALRFDAVPARLHPFLAADVVGERLEEMARLVASGRPSEAAALEPAIADGVARLRHAIGASGSIGGEHAESELAVLDAYVHHLPAGSQEVIGPVWATASSASATPAPPERGTGGAAEHPAGVNAAAGEGPRASAPPSAAPGRATGAGSSDPRAPISGGVTAPVQPTPEADEQVEERTGDRETGEAATEQADEGPRGQHPRPTSQPSAGG
ncbi:MAG: hypothetical protein K5924_10515 [Chloroflexi bacterium]|nr:hypothetical protein [Chloroflexota bacterium]